MIENRDIHSYNCNVFITREKKVYEVPILNGLEIKWERKGVPGQCTFTIMQETADKVEFEEGDEVQVKISLTWMFKGYIFTKSRGSDGAVKYTCYDQLRYLKAKEACNYTNKTVGEIVNHICDTRELVKGTIRDSTHRIESITRDSISFHDLILTAIEMTTEATGENFILYDRFGKITLCPLKHMKRNVVINSSVIGDFDYESTIDKQTYNMIRVAFKSGADGATVYKTERDQKNIDKWGLLQYTEKVESGWNSPEAALKLLELYNSKTKTLKIKNALGAVEVVAGAIIMVDLNLGDMVLTKNMVVDAVTHKIEDGLYSMDLELIGGEFVSTRGVQSEPEEKKEETSTAESGQTSSGGGNGASDWGHGISADAVKRALGSSRMSGYVDKIMSYSNAFKVDPALVTAIILAENGGNPGRNNKNSRFYYDPMSCGGGKNFSNIEKGLWAGIRNLSVNYIRPGGKYRRGNGTISNIGSVYCPVGAANDPNGTNRHWVPSVTKYYQSIAGHGYIPDKSGGGVASEQEATNNLNSAQNSNNNNSNNTGGSTSGNSYIEKAIEYALSKRGQSYRAEGQTWDTYSQLANRGRSNPKYTRNSYLYHSPENARTFDCSSLCYYAYVNAGFLKKVGGNAMTTVSLSSNPGAYKMKKVPLSQAKRGDILWRRGHVALYLGGGATVEANSPSQGINRWPNNLRLFNTAYRPIL